MSALTKALSLAAAVLVTGCLESNPQPAPEKAMDGQPPIGGEDFLAYGDAGLVAEVAAKDAHIDYRVTPDLPGPEEVLDFQSEPEFVEAIEEPQPSFPPPPMFGLEVLGYTLEAANGRMAVREPYIFASSPFDGFGVFDASDPSNIELVTEIAQNWAGYAGRPHLSDDGAVLFFCAGGTDVVAIDVTDPTAPAQVGIISLATVANYACGNMSISGNRMVVTGGSMALSVIDVTDPFDATIIMMDTAPVDGPDAWVGAATMVDETHGVLTMSGGIRQFDISDPAEPQFGPLKTTRYSCRLFHVGGTLQSWAPKWGIQVFDYPSLGLVDEVFLPGQQPACDEGGVDVAPDRFYFAGGHAFESGYLFVVDTSDPSDLLLMGAEPYAFVPGGYRDIKVGELHAYLLTYQALFVVDIIEKAP